MSTMWRRSVGIRSIAVCAPRLGQPLAALSLAASVACGGAVVEEERLVPCGPGTHEDRALARCVSLDAGGGDGGHDASVDDGASPPYTVGSLAPCLGGGNVLFFDGDAADWVHPGTLRLVDPGFRVRVDAEVSPASVDLSTDSAGFWDLEFSTRELGAPLRVGVYENAERAPFASAGHPGLAIEGDGRGCNAVSGRFQVHSVTVTSGRVVSFSATFEQHCEGGAAVLRGCVRAGS